VPPLVVAPPLLPAPLSLYGTAWVPAAGVDAVLPALGAAPAFAFALARFWEGTPLSAFALGSVGLALVSVGVPPLQAS